MKQNKKKKPRKTHIMPTKKFTVNVVKMKQKQNQQQKQKTKIKNRKQNKNLKDSHDIHVSTSN